MIKLEGVRNISKGAKRRSSTTGPTPGFPITPGYTVGRKQSPKLKGTEDWWMGRVVTDVGGWKNGSWNFQSHCQHVKIRSPSLVRHRCLRNNSSRTSTKNAIGCEERITDGVHVGGVVQWWSGQTARGAMPGRPAVDPALETTVHCSLRLPEKGDMLIISWLGSGTNVLYTMDRHR